MPTPVLKDRVMETSFTQGTGPYTLNGSIPGYQTFAAVGDGSTTYYAATDGIGWEVGEGTYAASARSLSRDTILASSNGGNAVNWLPTPKSVWVDFPASIAQIFANGTTGTGEIVLANGAAIDLTNATGLPLAALPLGTADLPILGNGASASSYRALPLTGTGVTGVLPSANGGEPVCATRTVLAGIDATKNTVAWLQETGRQGWFQWSSANLSAEVTIDTCQGIYVPPTAAPTGASGAWVRITEGYYELNWFGTVGDGVTDDAASIQCAINILPAKGGTIIALPAVYAVGTTITVGDSDGSVVSTRNGIRFIGGGMGLAANEAGGYPGGVVFKWIGASGGTVVKMNGPIVGCFLEGITVDANSLAATGFNLIFPILSHFNDLEVISQIGQAFIHTSVPSSLIAVGSYGNIFQNIKAIFPIKGSGAGGITIGSDIFYGTQGGLDVVRNIYAHLEMARDGSVSTSISIDLRFADNNQFYSTYTSRFYGTGGTGLKIDPPTGSVGFPNENTFFGAAIDSFSSPNNASLWAPLGGVIFYGFSVGDGEAVPSDSATKGAVSGFTTAGTPFGGVSIYSSWTPTIGVDAGSGYTFVLVSARFSKNFGQVFFSSTFEVTALGTGASGVTLTLPVNTADTVAVSAFNGVGGACYGQIVTGTPGLVTVRRYDRTFPATASGQFITVSGTYPS